MNYADRRGFLLSAGTGALGTMVMAGVPFSPARAAARSVPASPMNLKRTVVRDLIDGKTLSVSRVWRIRFSAHVTGWRVEGAQLSVDVDAPPRLAEIARIERERKASECFPLSLRPDGLIELDEPAESELDMGEVSRIALQTIDKLDSETLVRGGALTFLAQLDNAAQTLITRFPQDLFFPARTTVVERRILELPNGMHGEMEMRYTARSSTAGWLRSSERRVTTRIGRESARSVELWDLT